MECANTQESQHIAIHVTPPDAAEEEDEFAATPPPPAVRARRKLSSPLSALSPAAAEGLLGIHSEYDSGTTPPPPAVRARRKLSSPLSALSPAAAEGLLGIHSEYDSGTTPPPPAVRARRKLSSPLSALSPAAAEGLLGIHSEYDSGTTPPPPPAVRARRKLSSPLSALSPAAAEGLLGIHNGESRSARGSLSRRFSTMVTSAAAAAVSRRLSATIGWYLAAPTQVKPQIVRQGRALCLQYIRSQIRRSSITTKKVVMKRLQRMIETECGEDAVCNTESGVLAALRALCAALERKRPEAFRHVARQATRTPTAMLRSEPALSELALALARRITRENITWSKMAAVFCVCGALAREAAQASEGGEPPAELVAAPAAALADLLHEEPGGWVAAHGGWSGLIERLRASEHDQRSERTLRVMVAMFVLVCFTLLLLRWVIQAHPSYY